MLIFAAQYRQGVHVFILTNENEPVHYLGVYLVRDHIQFSSGFKMADDWCYPQTQLTIIITYIPAYVPFVTVGWLTMDSHPLGEIFVVKTPAE